MSKRRMMCPNDDCGHFGVERNVMGGCDCGTPLIPYVSPEARQWQTLSDTERRLVGYMMLADLQRRLSS